MNSLEAGIFILSILLGVSAAMPVFLSHELHKKGAKYDQH